MGTFLESTIFRSRWLLAPLYAGLSIVLVVYAVRFALAIYHLACGFIAFSDVELTLAVLHLVHIVMVCNLILMIMIGSYSLFIHGEAENPVWKSLQWLDHIDPGSLKVMMSMSFIGVSSIHLLEAIFNLKDVSVIELGKLITVHMVFVISTFAVAKINMMMVRRLAAHTES
jgi:uncharacterized protein (TIGR00645 family)